MDIATRPRTLAEMGLSCGPGKRQALDLFWPRAVAGANHCTIIDGLADPESGVVRHALDLQERSGPV